MQPVRFLAYSCVHVPHVDREAYEWMLGKVREYKPDVIVNLGDGIEAQAASRWKEVDEQRWALSSEYKLHCDLLRDVRKAAPRNCQLIYLPGNHDDNIQRPGRLDPDIRDLCAWYDVRNQPELANWKIAAEYNYCRTRGCYRIGQVVFAHGYEATPNGDEAQALYFANEYGLCVLGHTHRPTPGVMQAKKTQSLPLRYWYANVGCLRNLDPAYVARARKYMWGHACIVGEATPLKSPRASVNWSAHVETKALYDSWAGARIPEPQS